MNRKYIPPLAIATIATLLLAAAQGGASRQTSVFLLKSQGKTIAELRVEPGTPYEIQPLNSSGRLELVKTTGEVFASNGAKLTITSGTNSVTVTADEIEGRPEAK
jgi:hypothetical protein